MAKAKRETAKPMPPPEPVDPLEQLAKQFFELDQWRQQPEVADRLKQHERIKKTLQTAWKTAGRNAPWSGPGWQVYFVPQKGKSYIAPCDGCAGQTLHRDMEYHVKAVVMVEPPSTS